MNNDKLFASVGKHLNEAGFLPVLDAARALCAHPYAGWIDAEIPEHLTAQPLGALIEVIHQGKTRKGFLQSQFSELLLTLKEARIVVESGDVIAPGAWQITGYKGILAARDVPQIPGVDPDVYIGEDSLHFVDWIASANGGGVALDLGAGSGISSAALASHADKVIAVDIDKTCCEAIPLTASLNGVGARVESQLGDVTAGIDFDVKFSTIVANPPGVPIPSHLRYSPAGCGGVDGLAVSRSILDQAPRWLTDSGVLMLKFESVGDDVAPFALEHLKELSKANGWAAIFVLHSRIPMEVRSAISTRWAAPLNPTLSKQTLLETFDAHAARLGATQFYTCSVLIRATGRASLTTLPVYAYGKWLLDRSYLVQRAPSARSAPDATLLADYLDKVRILPDGLWELDVKPLLFAPLLRADDLCSALAAGRTLREAIRSVFKSEFDRDPINASALYVLSAVLLESIAKSGGVTLNSSIKSQFYKSEGRVLA